MGLGQKLSVNIAPLLLRVGIAATFIWIGTPMLRNMQLTAQQTATLANADIRQPDSMVGQPSNTPNATPPTPDTPPAEQPSGASLVPPPLAGTSLAGRPASPTPAAGPGVAPPRFTPEQFEGTDQTARRWVLVALTTLDAAQPIENADPAVPNRSILPMTLSTGGPWVKFGSIAFALIVAIGGYAVAIGFFTRLFALGLAACTGLSLWVLELGPAWATRSGILGFLPDPQISNPEASADIWMRLMLHVVVLMTCLALLILGPGRISLDALIFGRGKSTSHRNAFAEDED
jgi:uncharacterized membrane protein YphA (DoxX/SURF4 family)